MTIYIMIMIRLSVNLFKRAASDHIDRFARVGRQRVFSFPRQPVVVRQQRLYICGVRGICYATHCLRKYVTSGGRLIT